MQTTTATQASELTAYILRNIGHYSVTSTTHGVALTHKKQNFGYAIEGGNVKCFKNGVEISKDFIGFENALRIIEANE